jgi:hypothetical protein
LVVGGDAREIGARTVVPPQNSNRTENAGVRAVPLTTMSSLLRPKNSLILSPCSAIKIPCSVGVGNLRKYLKQTGLFRHSVGPAKAEIREIPCSLPVKKNGQQRGKSKHLQGEFSAPSAERNGNGMVLKIPRTGGSSIRGETERWKTPKAGGPEKS